MNVIAFYDANIGYIVGNYVVIRTTDGGNTWNDATPDNSELYQSVSAPGEFVAYVSCYSGKIFKTSNGGLTWSQQSSGTGNPLNSIFFPSIDTGYAAGGTSSIGNIVKTYNGGSTWTLSSFGFGFDDVHFINNITGYVSSTSSGTSYKTMDAGNTWISFSNPNSAWFAPRGIFFNNDSTGYFVGNFGYIYRTKNSGSSFCIQHYHANLFNLKSVFFVNDTVGFAVGADGTGFGAGFILKTINGGEGCPSANFSISSTDVCIGSTVSLNNTSTNAETYEWLENGVTFSTDKNTSRTFSAIGNYDISNVVNKNCDGCLPDTFTIIITVHPLPVADAGVNDTICQSDSIQLNATGGLIYAWLPSTGLSDDSIANPMASPSSTTTYFLTVTDMYGCSAQDNVKIVVLSNSSPTITASGSTTFCQGDSVTLTSSVAPSYQWNTGATTQSITVSSSGNYSVTIPNTNGCFATSSTTVTVNPLPTATITPSGATTFCQGNAVTLTANSANSYLWNNSATTQSITVSSSGNYSVTLTDGNGCSATSSATTVTVNPLPTAPTITANDTILTSSSTTGNQWYLNGNIINGATSQTYNVTQNGNYSVCVTDVNGCSSCSAPYNFTTVGLQELTNDNTVLIIPNPSNGKFKIKTDNLQSAKIKIYNSIGEIIYQSEIKNSEINLSSQPKGTYFIKLYSQDKIYNKTFIIQ